MSKQKSKGNEPTALSNSQYKDHPKTGWDIDGKGNVVGTAIEVDSIKYAHIINYRGKKTIYCNCLIGICCKRKILNCKKYRIVAYQRGR